MSKALFRVLIVIGCALDVVIPTTVAHFAPGALLPASIFTAFATTIGVGVASFYVKR